MMRNLSLWHRLVLTVILIGGAACQSSVDLAGEYEAAHHNNATPTVKLVLHADGRGSWIFEDDEALFKWEIRNREIWLHTKSGGLIAGKLDQHHIIIVIPELGRFVFQKTS